MSERLTDAELERLRAVVPSCHICGAVSVYIRDIQSMAVELLARRAADTKPPPTEQGTLRDEMATQFAASMILVIGSSDRPLRFGSNHPTAMEDSSWSKVTAASYRMADAMLAERAKGAEKP